jgi:pimeloyl-ACP methyl ester carboxylesterase
VIDAQGLDIISAYVGRNPAQKTYEEAAQFRDRNWVHFKNVPMERWLAEVRAHYEQTADGLVIRYDPKLRDTFNAADNNAPSLWPFFDALDGLPIALIRGTNSDLLSLETADEMSKRRPDMIRAEVPDRGHVPFLDEAEAIEALRAWLSAVKDTQA